MNIHDIAALPVRETIARAKFIHEDKVGDIDKIKDEISKSFKGLKEKVAQEA